MERIRSVKGPDEGSVHKHLNVTICKLIELMKTYNLFEGLIT